MAGVESDLLISLWSRRAEIEQGGREEVPLQRKELRTESRPAHLFPCVAAAKYTSPANPLNYDSEERK